MRQELGREKTVFVHVTLVPWIAAAQELKTKPTQHSVKELLSIGIQADILLCRTDRFLSRDVKSKIAAFCNVEDRAVITAKDVDSIYECPLVFHQEGVDALALKYLHIDAKEADLSKWQDLVHRAYNPQDEVSIGIVGKYVEYEDSYKSLKEALTHGALAKNLKLRVTWIEAEGLESKHEGDESYKSQLAGFDGILVPGGFGKRGIEGMLNAIRYARENNVPYFGICLGMQTACIEFARNVCGLAHANSSEFDPAAQHRIIYKLRELTGVEEMGGTMRLGAWTCILQPDSIAAHAYSFNELSSRATEGSRRTCSSSESGNGTVGGRGTASAVPLATQNERTFSPSGALRPKQPRQSSPSSIRNQRTPPPPLRIQPRIRSAPHRSRPKNHRNHPRRHLRRNSRNPQPPLLPGLPIPPRIQIQTPRATPSLPGVYRGELWESDEGSARANCGG